LAGANLFAERGAPAMFLPSCSGTDLLKGLEMQPPNIPAVLIAIALAAACIAGSWLISAAIAQGPERISPAASPSKDESSAAPHWSEGFAGVVARTTVHVVEASKRVPLLIAVLSAVLLLPAVALASYLVQSRARRKRERAASLAAEARAGIADTTRESADAAAPLWPHQAWLSLEDAKAVPLAGQVIRIGRDRENDIRLPDASVHRYHAVIEHTPEEAFVITDLSGKDGNGLRVNGKKLIRAELADGDLIELGRTRLRFESVPV
jgi:hypothetical protein